MARIAITGGIGEGKSTVLAMLAEMGFATASSDAVAREIFAEPATQASVARMTGLPQPIDPKALRAALADSEEVRRSLNRLMHPRVVERMASHEATFFEVPLLIEVASLRRYDATWVVTCGPEEQRRRLLDRYADLAHVERILSTQLPTPAKIPFADLVIRTNEPLATVRRVLERAAYQLATA